MDGAEQILVVILSSTLAIFLILAIIATVKIIQILNSFKRITEKAEQIAERADSLSDIFAKSAGPAAIGRLFYYVADTVFGRGKGKSKHRKEHE